MNHPSIEKIWQHYRLEHPDAPETYDAWAFGDSKEMADDLLELVLQGKKTATASNYELYEVENEPIPYEGLHNIILNGQGEAIVIIVTVAVDIVPFNEVSADFAYLEGEGDRSLHYWREAHEAFFKREFAQMNREFHEDMPVICEQFKLVYAGKTVN